MQKQHKEHEPEDTNNLTKIGVAWPNSMLIKKKDDSLLNVKKLFTDSFEHEF